MDWLISPAMAQTATTASQGSGLMQFLPLILIFGVMYFFLIMPQQKRMKKHQEKIGSIIKNDKIVLQSGVLGKVIKLHEPSELEVEIAKEVRVRVMKNMVADVIRPEPINKN